MTSKSVSRINLRRPNLRRPNLRSAYLRSAYLRSAVYGILVVASVGIAATSPAIGSPLSWQAERETATPLPSKGIISEDASPSAKTAPDPPLPFQKPDVRQREARQENCRLCHNGIEEISASHPLSLGCTVCHGGEALARDKDRAHATLIHDPAAGTGKRNPSSLRVAARSCGQSQCHAGFEREDRNHVARVRKSMMGTLAGMIAGLRFQWAGQTQARAKYGVHAVVDQDRSIPESRGALSHLRALPFFSPLSLKQERAMHPGSGPLQISKHIGDSLLRKVCFQCHLDSPPPPGEYRSQGCAACHFTYNAAGRYQGNDATISKAEPGHAAFHRMTALPAQGLCLQCHKSLALSSHGSPTKLNKTPAVPWPGRGLIKTDVHLARGMECIDCHTQFDIMGDGNIYSRQYQAVEIRCETCHGDSESLPTVAEITDPEDRVIRLARHYQGFTNTLGDKMVLSARHNKLTNVKMLGGKIVTLSKRTGKKFITPLVKNSKYGHRIPQHQSRLACTACHSQWVPKCAGCDAFFKASIASSSAGNFSGAGDWTHGRPAMEVEEPLLMVGPRGRVTPMTTPNAHTLTVLDAKGHPLSVIDKNGDALGQYKEWQFVNPLGYSGSQAAHATAPHSVGAKTRSCTSCHFSPRALGLGDGDLKIGKTTSGKRDFMAPVILSDRVSGKSKQSPLAKVSPQGQSIAGVSQGRARLLNQQEITRILKVSNCLPCHRRDSDRIYKDINKSYKFEKLVKHRRLRNKILNKR